METHNFEEPLALGQRGEGALDFLFVMLGYTVVTASAAEQHLSIDLIDESKYDVLGLYIEREKE